MSRDAPSPPRNDYFDPPEPKRPRVKRPYMAPPGDERCRADRLPFGDGSGAQCMRRATHDGYCWQHAPNGSGAK